jgi:hypothetical protein
MKTVAPAVSLFAAISAAAVGGENDGGPVCFPSCIPGIVKKVNGIVIPKVEFRNVTVSEAIEFLRQKSRQLDPDGTGVNIVLKLTAEAKLPVASPPLRQPSP